MGTWSWSRSYESRLVTKRCWVKINANPKLFSGGLAIPIRRRQCTQKQTGGKSNRSPAA